MGEGDALERFGPEEIDSSRVKGDLAMKVDEPPGREGAATAEDWRCVLAKVVPAVVVLRTTAARAFDTETAGASYATGFVVDKVRGIILTNRHVVKPGTLFRPRPPLPIGFRNVLASVSVSSCCCRSCGCGGDVR